MPSLSDLEELKNPTDFYQQLNKHDYRNLYDKKGRSAVHVAAKHNHMLNIRIMAQRGYAISHQDNRGRTPMHEAAINFQYLAILELLALKADYKTEDNDGNRPLDLLRYDKNKTYDRYDTVVTNKTAQVFPSARHDHVEVYFGRNDVITDILFTKPPISTISCHSELQRKYPICFVSNKAGQSTLAPELMVIFRQSYYAIGENIKSKFVNQHYEVVFENTKSQVNFECPLVNRQTFAELINLYYLRMLFDINNLFIGDEIIGEASEWLLDTLLEFKKREQNISLNYPLIIQLDFSNLDYHHVYIKDKRYAPYYDSQKTCFVIDAMKDFDDLLAIANRNQPYNLSIEKKRTTTKAELDKPEKTVMTAYTNTSKNKWSRADIIDLTASDSESEDNQQELYNSQTLLFPS